MKKIMTWAAVLAVTIIAMGCASKSVDAQTTEEKAPETPAVVQKEEPKEPAKPASDKPFGIADERYAQLLDKSFVSTGNTYRMKKLIQKMEAGEEVYIAALGGSVTEGAGPKDSTGKELWKLGYAYVFKNKLVEKYAADASKVYFDGAGLSGTPSLLGLTRYESDVVQVLGHEPDLLIIEFAVNDDGGDGQARAFEALVRNALEANEEAVVIGLYSAATYGNTAAQKKPIGNYYQIPQVNVLDLVQYAIASKDFTKEGYYSDYVHPTKEGHEIQADCLMNVVEKSLAAADEEPFAIPADWFKKKAFTNFTRILGDDDSVKITKGNFDATDNATQGLKKTGKGDFPQNWHHTKGTEQFVMNIKCKALILTYKEQGSWLPEKFGKAEIYVDGNKVATYDGGKQGGWCNCVPVVIIDEADVADHLVEIKMIEGDENKGFTIVAMGYSK